ncbi:MAG: hypothetical protein HYW22_00725 [Candidatus Aenigmarchaeota archaeon]|nr:hypothetical protein [Candidatus Aenigmarchaeota archaeon]
MGSKFALLIAIVVVGLLIVPAYALLTANELFDMMIREMIRFGASADTINQNLAQKELVTSGFTHVAERPGTRENPTNAPTQEPQQRPPVQQPVQQPASSGGGGCVPSVAVSCEPVCTAVTCGQPTTCVDNCGNRNKPGTCAPCPTFQCTPTITSCNSQCTASTCGQIVGCQDNCQHTISSTCPACPTCAGNGQTPSGTQQCCSGTSYKSFLNQCRSNSESQSAQSCEAQTVSGGYYQWNWNDHTCFFVPLPTCTLPSVATDGTTTLQSGAGTKTTCLGTLSGCENQPGTGQSITWRCDNGRLVQVGTTCVASCCKAP